MKTLFYTALVLICFCSGCGKNQTDIQKTDVTSKIEATNTTIPIQSEGILTPTVTSKETPSPTAFPTVKITPLENVSSKESDSLKTTITPAEKLSTTPEPVIQSDELSIVYFDKPTWKDESKAIVYFGCYPQSEVKGEALTDSIINADYDEKSRAVADGIYYKRISEKDIIGKKDAKGYYDWSSGGYRYFIYKPLEWRVVQGASEGELFLVSEYSLITLPYNEKAKAVTWEDSSLRQWLNEDFINEAFTQQEQEALLMSTIVNAKNQYYTTTGGNDTNDRVFCLSIDEALSLKLGRLNTDYASAMGAYSATSKANSGKGYYWLRSPGNRTDSAARVDYTGSVDDGGNIVNTTDVAVCPALRIMTKNIVE